ncbi:hypothetical protein TNCV_965991 [Trichonephila clavipes]|nr:hypothetical protein TNCV_965991 [Trichonephila clavipes]
MSLPTCLTEVRDSVSLPIRHLERAARGSGGAGLIQLDSTRFSGMLKVSEGRKVRSGYLPFRTNASTLPITPKRSSSRDVGASSHRYHTVAYSPASVLANRRTNDTIFVASM